MGPGEHHCHSGVYSLDAIGIGVDMQEAILFYILGSLAVVCSLGVLLSKNPVSSALYLALTMVGLSFVFVGLDAFFIGMVQLAVYAGAVMVLFVMVVMLFDLKKEEDSFSPGFFGNGLKVILGGFMVGAIASVIAYSTEMILSAPKITQAEPVDMSVKALARLLFTDYVVAFEILGVLLLLVAIGAVALSRIPGGTHADD